MSPFDPPPLAAHLLASPLLFILRPLHALLLNLRPAPCTRTPSQRPIRVVCISDTHDHHLPSVPDGDLLIHAGDLTNSGTRADIQLADGTGDGDAQAIDWGSIHYLQNNSLTLTFPSPASADSGRSSHSTTSANAPSRTLTIHGAPQIPQLDPSPDSVHAFQYPPSLDPTTTTTAAAATSGISDFHAYPYPTPIPHNTDILVTHTPPAYHLDNYPYSVGCPFVLRAIWRVRPLLHVCGHVHVGRGVDRAYYDRVQEAWEALCAVRSEQGLLWERGSGIGSFVRGGGWWRDLCGVGGVWAMAWRVVWEGIKAVVVGRLWRSVGEGGRAMGLGLGREGWIVNAACLDGSGKVLRGATVIKI
ncbi:phosphoric ester hydrolase [Histoplasma capsulatum var. duboisii H88]|uniref:Phosphoric ester hydrolase n=1 Tax=Ajellomyces capsulatus (strain H88) TaxID=544711 RepID=F0UL91_AJEC8|nr:phosphoric ester hydrolase [Histoplasma capsulatum var. duboisii H88]